MERVERRRWRVKGRRWRVEKCYNQDLKSFNLIYKYV